MKRTRRPKVYESACTFLSRGIVIYIGKAKQFGGKSGRYAYGYRYLVDALLKSGAKLYLAKLSKGQWKVVKDYENTLINSTKGKKSVNRHRAKNFKSVAGIKGP